MLASLSASMVEAATDGDLEAARVADAAIGQLLDAAPAAGSDGAEVVDIGTRRVRSER